MSNAVKRKGELNKAKNGLLMQIIEYRNANDIDIKFEDGVVVEHTYYKSFKEGCIKHPNIRQRRNKSKKVKDFRLGEQKLSNEGFLLTITDYVDANNITVQFEDGTVISNAKYKSFREGIIQHPNVGLKHIGETAITIDGDSIVIVEYRSHNDIDVKFNDGSIVRHKSYYQFRCGNIKHPSLGRQNRRDWVNNQSFATNGLKMTVMESNKNGKLNIQFEDGTVVLARYQEFLKGLVGHPKITCWGRGNLYNFNLNGFAYKLKDRQDVFYFCECTKCRCKDILSPKQMLEHKCEV